MRRSTAVALVAILAGCGTQPAPDTGDLLLRLARGNARPSDCHVDEVVPALTMRRALALCALGDVAGAQRLARLALARP